MGKRRAWYGRWGVLLWALVSQLHAAPLPDGRDAAWFERWRVTRAAEVTALQQHLQAHGVEHLVPMHELLRSASDWQRCKAEPFALPPRTHWAAVVSVLRLLRSLRAEGVLDSFEVRSAYRDAALNQCAGGAARSAHLRAFAVDLLPTGGHDPAVALCQFWKDHGRAWNMGLSRYPSGRIHVDTAGYRTWGASHGSASAFCR